MCIKLTCLSNARWTAHSWQRAFFFANVFVAIVIIRQVQCVQQAFHIAYYHSVIVLTGLLLVKQIFCGYLKWCYLTKLKSEILI